MSPAILYCDSIKLEDKLQEKDNIWYKDWLKLVPDSESSISLSITNNININNVSSFSQGLPKRSTSLPLTPASSLARWTGSSTVRFWWTWAEASTGGLECSRLPLKESTSSSSPPRRPTRAWRPTCGWWSTVTGSPSPTRTSPAAPAPAACLRTWRSSAEGLKCTSPTTVAGPGPAPPQPPSHLEAHCLYKWDKAIYLSIYLSINYSYFYSSFSSKCILIQD